MAQGVTVKVVAKEGAVVPQYKTAGAAGADVCALLQEPLVIPAGGRALVATGLFLEIPQGYEVQVRPRSGLALKHGVTVLNAPGTIDSDYRGELMVLLANLGGEPFTVQGGDRIAQLVVAPVTVVQFQAATELSCTERGAGGFGSTGTRQ